MNQTSKDDEGWQSLLDAVRDQDLVLILGAGVSYGSGLPNWGEFVHRLATAAHLSEKAIEDLRKNHGWTWPAITSVIRARSTMNRTGFEKQWPDLVRSKLYEKCTWYHAHAQTISEAENKKRRNPKVAKCMETNRTLVGVVDLCAVPYKRGWRSNPRIAAVLTYNLDAVLQIYDRSRHGSPRIFRTVERASKLPERGKIPVYHLHGYLRPDKESTRKEAADALVLCEDEYHRRTDEPYSFATTTTLWALREYVGVFVGCSMGDDLMRRVLYRSRYELRAALSAEGRSSSHNALRRHYAIMLRSKERHVNDLVDQDLGFLGVRPLWVDDVGEIEQRLRQLGKSLL